MPGLQKGLLIVDSATVLAIVGSRMEAELVVGMLRSHGLRAALVADDAGGMRPHLQMQGVRVLVHPSDETSARRLLAAVDDTAGPIDVDAAAAQQRSAATDRIERDQNDPQQDL